MLQCLLDTIGALKKKKKSMRSLIESAGGSLCGGHRVSDINAAPANTVKLFTSFLMSGGAAEWSLSN